MVGACYPSSLQRLPCFELDDDVVKRRQHKPSLLQERVCALGLGDH